MFDWILNTALKRNMACDVSQNMIDATDIQA